MAFLPDGNALITQRSGELMLRDMTSGTATPVLNVPKVVHEDQGGLGDVAVSPQFAVDQLIYISWAQAGPGGSGAAVAQAKLVRDAGPPRLTDVKVVWEQTPKTSGFGHYAHRIAFSPDGQHLFITSGDRQKMAPAQDNQSTLGTVVRLDRAGRAAPDNPFNTAAAPTNQIWSYGHRNPLGLAFAPDGVLWSSEMGPKGGDELNVIQRGRNYGWPLASNGSHYEGTDIPDHRPTDGFAGPAVSWNPSVSPGSLMVYSGKLFPQWHGDAFIGALSGKALIRVDISHNQAKPAEHWDMGERIREVEQGPDGSIWLLEDAGSGRLLRIAPK